MLSLGAGGLGLEKGVGGVVGVRSSVGAGGVLRGLRVGETRNGESRIVLS